MNSPRELEELVGEIIAMREKAGFNPATAENLPVKLMCINCEIVELEEAIAFFKYNDDIRLELADITMYALATAYDLRGKLALRHSARAIKEMATPETLCTPMRKYTVRAMEHWRKGEITDAALSVELVVFEAQKLASALNIDLVGGIYAKLEINDHRPHTHGGKHPDS